MGTKDNPPEDALVKALLKPQDMSVFTVLREVLKPSFKMGFYDVAMAVKGHSYMATLPVTVSNILKGGASPEQKTLCRNKLMSMFKSALADAGIEAPGEPEGDYPHLDKLSKLTQAIHAEKKIPGMPKIGEIEAAVEKANKGKKGPTFGDMMAGKPEALEAYAKLEAAKDKAKGLSGNQLPVDGEPVPLKNAKALGQPVRGTNHNSVYYTVALSERVRLAIRVHNDVVSVRAEGDFLGIDVKKMQAFGMSAGNGGEYYSMHLACEGVPIPRVIGSILFGLGLDFDQQLTSFKQLKVQS